ncbi:MAG: hypothetical protein COV74_06575 [Candidatus Omnitrophica bacterium CG11_big_fil_rev_8_21_14_0_20_45_26]|uniref:Glycosyl transferase n=1 Tax=Candidatus Abzuiibacterium crystallinum TaxID=1974748 RepID=A0A2H0LNH4_9BACT|nr:MAG: hypothetical protein COV74_06575 [Candidatus Omnitrophica bacterium CG11_big_fil_rev_8_21_14_0_20_45_26]PIW64739.1 MAG: hypothetical protein COW12_04970 [Candidatus Omnitrophica bacterium CG12_big_fil_rev_8_21_14_0_65_45_16]
MKVLHVTADFEPKWGGVYHAVTGMADSLSKHTDVHIFGSTRTKNPDAGTPHPRAEVFPTASKFQFSFAIKKKLEEAICAYDLVHIHGLWQFPLSYAAALAKKKGIPYVYHIHGMLDEWCLKHHAVRKYIYSALWERAHLNGARRIICVTEHEEKQLKHFGVTAPTIVIPNGITRDDAEAKASKELFLKKYPVFESTTIITTLGRIHPKKGLDLLLRAFEKLFQPPGRAKLIIAGPSEDKPYERKLRRFVDQHKLGGHVIFLGPIYGDEKKAMLAASHIFVLASRDEGFSLSLLEAMAQSVPVIVTDACHFPQIETQKAGIQVSPDPNEILSAISLLVVDERKCQEMGEAGRRLVLAQYQWDAIALKLVSQYRQILEEEKK